MGHALHREIHWIAKEGEILHGSRRINEVGKQANSAVLCRLKHRGEEMLEAELRKYPLGRIQDDGGI